MAGVVNGALRAWGLGTGRMMARRSGSTYYQTQRGNMVTILAADRARNWNVTPLSLSASLHTGRVTMGAGGVVNHRDTKDNNEALTFDFSRENMTKVNEILAKYPEGYKKSASIPLLDLAQRQNGGFLSIACMKKVAKILEVPYMQVYEVATFYTMFNRKPVGKHFVQVCTTTPCELCGSGEIVRAIKDYLGVEAGQVTEDGLFSVIEVECLGACVNAPMMQIGDSYYEDLTPESAVNILKQFRDGKTPKVGVQHDRRRVAEPEGGKTTLLEPIPDPSAPNLDVLLEAQKGQQS
eukprot:CAMPEP_0119157778 /NCGR_PEP_ID=MMETSP1310-20130426/52928_1 /TAXON_ID=464262 /ORGANISM="Genus nov. species nov., Strain RCC2339" /LENGTH=293 /DNA_ID=CAMNT_0007150397 /DNA_START=21 /DNA_END=902 /DNA_ORIENTATION=+